MRNKIRVILIGVLVAIVVIGGGLFLWARSVLAQDSVRAALAAELSSALGQPVTVGSISAGLYPRVTVNLGEVAIGQPPRIQVRTLSLGTGLGALLSRRIEQASVHLEGAKIELPLPCVQHCGRARGRRRERGAGRGNRLSRHHHADRRRDHERRPHAQR